MMYYRPTLSLGQAFDPRIERMNECSIAAMLTLQSCDDFLTQQAIERLGKKFGELLRFYNSARPPANQVCALQQQIISNVRHEIERLWDKCTLCFGTFDFTRVSDEAERQQENFNSVTGLSCTVTGLTQNPLEKAGSILKSFAPWLVVGAGVLIALWVIKRL